MSTDVFHRLLEALGAPPEVGDGLLAALQDGHDLYADQPAALSSVHRWTCRRCDGAVLWSPSANVLYGSATERSCIEEVRHWQAMGLATRPMLAWLAEHDQEARSGLWTICSRCGREHDSQPAFCKGCGEPLREVRRG